MSVADANCATIGKHVICCARCSVNLLLPELPLISPAGRRTGSQGMQTLLAAEQSRANSMEIPAKSDDGMVKRRA